MIVTAGMLVTLLVLLVLAAAGTAVLIAAPWSARATAERVPASTQLRIGRAVVGFDLWLDWYGVPGRRRRPLCAELRANLYEAASTSGARAAVQALGPLRSLAREYALAERSSTRYATRIGALRLRARRGLGWAGVTAAAIAVLSMVTMLTWANAALASDATTTAGRPVSSPWIYQEVRQLADGGLTADTRIDGWVVLLPLAAFAAGALAWRRPRRETVPR